MSILLLHEGYAPAVAGAECIAYETADGLSGMGMKTTLWTDRPPAPAAGFPVLAATRHGFPERDVDLPEWLFKEAPELIHVIDLTPRAAELGTRLLDRLGCGLVVTPATHCSFWAGKPECTRLLHRADVVVALSQFEVGELAMQGIAASAVAVIRHLGRMVFRGRDVLPLIGDAPYVLFLGRMMRSKGYYDLLQAARLVWAQSPATRFVFAGPAIDDDVVSNFQQYADPRIEWRGLVDEREKHSLLGGAALFCLPTRADVLPLTILEAWSHGTPVVCYDYAPGVPDAGLAGPRVSVPPDITALARTILRILSDEDFRRQLGQAGPAYLRSYYDPEDNLRKLAAMYREVTARRLRK